MADMTATGWYPSNITVMQTARPWGVGSRKEVVVKLLLNATNFGGGAALVPREGIPVPAANSVGLDSHIDYVIPLAPFTHVTLADSRFISWGCIPRSDAVSGSTPQDAKMVVIGYAGGLTPSQGPTFPLMAASGFAASTLFTTDQMQTYAVFIGQ